MQPAPLSSTTSALVAATFGAKDRDRARALLEEQCGTNLPFLSELGPVQLERYRFAAIKVSAGRLGGLERAIALAKTDWRDLLMEADFGHDVRAHERWCEGILAAPDRGAARLTNTWSPHMLEGACHCGSARWRLDEMPESATACNCTACRRYGVLWAYGWEGENIRVEGETTAYVRGNSLSFNFCPRCGGVTHWRALQPGADGRRRIAVNLRMTEPGPIAALPIDHFDGLDKWEDLPRDGRCIRDLWF